MKKTLLLFAIILLSYHCFSQVSRAQVEADINTNIYQNSSHQITGSILNTILKEINNSAYNIITDAVVAYTVTPPLALVGTNISITQADASHNGYLLATHWNLFNNKQDQIIAGSGITIVGNTISVTGGGAGTVSSVTVTPGYDVTGVVSNSTTTPAMALTIGALKVVNSMIAYSTIDLTTKVVGILPLANGGHASSTANGGFNNLAPSQVGNAGKFLTTNGTNTSWAAASGGGGSAVTITNDNSTDARYYPAWLTSNTGTVTVINVSDQKFTFNPSNGHIGLNTYTTVLTDDLTFGGTTTRSIGMLTNTVSATQGQQFTIHGSGATLGGTNLNGGGVTIATGTSQGTGTAPLTFQTTSAGSTGTGTNNPTTKMTITGSGRVGIGTISPNAMLSVGSSSQFQVDTFGNIIKIRNVTSSWPTSNSAGVLTNDGSGTLTWASAGGSGWLLTGNASTTGANFLGTTDLKSLYFRANNAPSGFLDVTNGNTFFGYFSGINTLVGGVNNTGIGGASLAAITGGSYNTSLGTNSLVSITGTNYNTAVGYQALYNTTGTGSIGIGAFAGMYETGSNAFYLNNQDRTNTAGDKTKSLMYAVFNSNPLSQSLTLNATLKVVDGSQAAQKVFTSDVNGLGTWSTPTVTLTSQVAGILPLANGGTNSSLTAVNGGAVYSTASTMSITAAGTSGQVLTSNGAAAPTWQTVSGGSGWGLTGNSGTTSSNFLGTTTNGTPLIFRAGNVWAGFLSNTVSVTSFGYNSYSVNTTGSGNTGFGFSAGQSNTTGSGNSFLGDNSGLNNTTGSYNTAVGASALSQVTTKSGNIAIGSHAGEKEKTSYKFYLSSHIPSDSIDGRANAFMYGDMDETTPSNKYLWLNSRVGINSYGTPSAAQLYINAPGRKGIEVVTDSMPGLTINSDGGGTNVLNSNTGSYAHNYYSLGTGIIGYSDETNADLSSLKTVGSFKQVGLLTANTLSTTPTLSIEKDYLLNGFTATSPMLWLNDNTTATGDLISANRGGTNLFKLTSAGNVGVGVSSPDAKLELAASTSSVTPCMQFNAGTPRSIMSGAVNFVDAGESFEIVGADGWGKRVMSSGTPTIATALTATVAITGDDMAGVLSFQTGSTPADGAILATVTFEHSYLHNPVVVLQPSTNANAALSPTYVVMLAANAGFEVHFASAIATTPAWNSSNTRTWNYIVKD